MQTARTSSFAGSAVAARPAAAARAARGQVLVQAGINAHKENKFTEELQATAKYISQVCVVWQGNGWHLMGCAGGRARKRAPTPSPAPDPMQRGRGILASDESNATTGACVCCGTAVWAGEGRLPVSGP